MTTKRQASPKPKKITSASTTRKRVPAKRPARAASAAPEAKKTSTAKKTSARTKPNAAAPVDEPVDERAEREPAVVAQIRELEAELDRLLDAASRPPPPLEEHDAPDAQDLELATVRVDGMLDAAAL